MNRFFPRTAAALAAALTFSTASAFAGAAVDAKGTIEKQTPNATYEAGRGLLTLEGPSGMFINPTSATLPQGRFTAQYCLFFPNNDGDVIGHGLMASYGITDWLEAGVNGNLVDLNNAGNQEVIGGPLVRLRLAKDEGWMPQLSIGFYGKYGTQERDQSTVFIAAYKRFPIGDEQGFVKSIGVHAGVRGSYYNEAAARSNSVAGYGGVEVQLPARIYLVGEIGTDSDFQGGRLRETPYAFGVQWRLGGVNLSVAGIKNGTTDEISIFSGVGVGFGF